MNGPGKGTIRLLYRLQEQEKHWRTMVRQVSIFSNVILPPVRVTYYDYEFTKCAGQDYGSLMLPEDILVTKTTETDGDRTTEFNYGTFTSRLYYWEDNDHGRMIRPVRSTPGKTVIPKRYTGK